MSSQLHAYKKKHEKPTNVVDLKGISTQKRGGRGRNFRLAAVQLRLADLRAAPTAAVVSADLKRWLPSSWKMDDAVAATMIAVSVQKLVEAVAVMAARFPRDASPEAAS